LKFKKTYLLVVESITLVLVLLQIVLNLLRRHF
jgi:hypothetical protein